jgi:tRNA nucleotidyltransferase/poly(A) polymerase
MPLANKREARRFQRFATYNNFLDMEDDPNVRVYGAFKRGQLVGYMAVRIASPAPEPPNYRKATDEKHCGGCKMFDKGLCWGYGNRPVKEDYVCDSFAPEGKTSSIISNEPEILMIDTVKQGHGVGTALMRLAQAQYDSFFTHTDSTAGERLAKRMGMVNVNGQRWRWVKEGKDPKDMIEADIPFVYNIEGTKDHKQGMIYIGYAGQSTHDVHPPAGQRFTPGGIVEGYYQPGGKVLIVNETDTPWTIYGFANLWYALYPQMEITGIELQEDDGKTTKLAATTDIPPEPGSTPIPDGHVRLWHYTEGDPEAVRQQGLLMNRAKGENYGEPNQIWASARPPEFMTHNVVEFHVPVNDPRWNFGKYEPYINYGEGYQMPQDYGRYLHDRGAHVTFLGDIRPDEIVAVHEPWHHHYHYLMSHHGDPSGDPSQFDFLKDDRHYGPALEAWKNSLWPKTTKTAANSIGTYLRAMTAADPAASRAYQALKAAGGHVYAVGGAVRDALRGRDPKDIDLVVTGLPPEEVAFALGQLPGRIDLTGKRFGVYRYRTHGQDVEVALPREDKYDAGMRGRGEITVDHRLPIEQDLMRRDFTANSMAVDLDTGQLLDPAGGARDIEANRLKQTHADAFREDPTRLIRALTMHGHHGLIPDEDTRADMARHAHALKGESPDALNKVIDKMMTSYHPANAIRLAKDTGVLDHLFPEVADNWDFNQNNHNHAHPLGDHLVHTLDNVSQLTDDPDVRMAALYHDVGKPASEWKDENGESHYYENEFGQGAHHELVGARMAQDRLEALNYPRARINRVIDLIRGHMFPAGSSMRWARRFVNKYGDHAEDLLTLRQADVEGKGIPQDPQKTPVHTMRNLVSQVRQEQQPTALSQLAINGNDLLSMGLLPGPQIGQILQQLMNDVMETPALNNKDALLSLAARYIQNLTTNRSDTKC